ncbi:MAG TPA: aldehyde dehydrogenase family protein [candidate division Zixibacteria bacterium]|nr:aldehyde dehydrogenase family protein [candidate division Zixibacteria bacterium]
MGEPAGTRLDVDGIMNRAAAAAEAFRRCDQEHTDRIVTAVYRAGFDQRIPLAKMAAEETGLGVWQDKVIKNVIATRFVYENIKTLKTVGVIAENEEAGIVEIAQPIGPIFAVTPITNPTSTVLFKILIALKARNPIVIRPHGAARKCSIEAARICYEAALAAGAPEHCVQWVRRSTEEETLALTRHRKTALILATGSEALVRAAYSSGNPAIGVGPGNVPVFIGKTADVPFAVDQIVMSKTLDHGTVCASEQALVVRACHAAETRRLLIERGAYFLTPEEIRRLETVAFNPATRVMRVEVIGQPAEKIARMAGIEAPAGTRLLVAELEDVGPHTPLSLEILAPVLAFYVAEDIDQAIALCRKINHNGGLGHTISMFSNNEERIRYFASTMNAGRILVNTPASQGVLGGTYNALQPSLTLGCGTGGKNITTDNISARHLLNIQRIARRRVSPCIGPEMMAAYLDETVDALALERRCAEMEAGAARPGDPAGEPPKKT